MSTIFVSHKISVCSSEQPYKPENHVRQISLSEVPSKHNPVNNMRYKKKFATCISGAFLPTNFVSRPPVFDSSNGSYCYDEKR